MKSHRFKLIIISMLLTANNAFNQKVVDKDIFTEKKSVDYVNPFIGTGGHGHTFPGPTMPFGMVQLSPDTRLTGWDGCSGYHFTDSIIYGFSHTHLSGTGVSDYGDILLMPTVGEKQFQSGYLNENEKTTMGYGSAFKKETEKASAGYYSVFLDDYKILAELSATPRCGIHKYSFPESNMSNIILDLTHRDKVIYSDIEFISPTEVSGTRISSLWATKQYLYFYIKLSKKPYDYGIVKNDTLLRSDTASGTNIKAFFTFRTAQNEPIIVKTAISAVSKEGAYQNYLTEIDSISFSEVREQASLAWQNELAKVKVQSDVEADKEIFYTAIYHAYLAPNLFHDVDGSYRGTDLQIHKDTSFTNYTVFSLWDTFRAEHPLFTILQQQKTTDFIQTFLHQYENGSKLPVWELAGNYTGCMIGYHSVPVIVDAYLKGISNFDAEKALLAMKNSANMHHLGIPEYKKFGYIPANLEHESVSKTLEYAYDDWCISQMAKALGNDKDYNTYIRRAQYYKNLFDAETGFLRAKKNACWVEPFDAREVNFNFTEANAWQYTFFVPQDISGLVHLMGGPDKFSNKLDLLFSENTATTGRGQVDITGLIGQYAHGNEPSHHMAYLYNYVAEPWKTQKLVSQIMQTMYSKQPNGLIGNEDCGQMSAWYIFSAMGFYPVTPGSDIYVIGTPLFNEMQILLENGNSFNIVANNLSKENIYIQSIYLNDTILNRTYIKHKEIMAGGQLVFNMGSQPNYQLRNYNIPYSGINDLNITTVPALKADNNIFTDSLTVSVNCTDSNYSTYYKNLPDTTWRAFKNPITIKEKAQLELFAKDTNRQKSKTVYANFYKIPGNLHINIAQPYAKQYAAGGDNALIDGITGSKDFRLGAWQGYQQVDLEAVIVFNEKRNIDTLSIDFLQDINSWIFMPYEVEFFVSKNGKSYKSLGIIKNKVQPDNWDVLIQEFKTLVNRKGVKSIKVIGRNIKTCPKWHKAAGHKAWIFVDEIKIN